MINFNKQDFTNMSKPVQITSDDIEISSTLETDDVGYWCIIVNGTYQGFCDTEQECQELYELLSD